MKVCRNFPASQEVRYSFAETLPLVESNESKQTKLLMHQIWWTATNSEELKILTITSVTQKWIPYWTHTHKAKKTANNLQNDIFSECDIPRNSEMVHFQHVGNVIKPSKKVTNLRKERKRKKSNREEKEGNNTQRFGERSEDSGSWKDDLLVVVTFMKCWSPSLTKGRSGMLRAGFIFKVPCSNLNTLDMATRRSDVFFTGRKRFRGTLIPKNIKTFTPTKFGKI